MNKQLLVRLFLGSSLIALLSGCALFPHSGPSALVGTWTNSGKTIWIIRGNGTFDVDLDGDGKRDSWGKYKVDGDMVTLTGTGGFLPRGCKGKGLYHFERTAEDKLQFTLIQDSCKLRRKNILLPWQRK